MALRPRVRWALRVVSLIVVVAACWALLIEPNRLVVRHVELELPKWPREHAGLRVALLADLHVGSPHWGVAHVRELVATTNAEKPDLILLAGDYVIDGVLFGKKVEPEAIAAVLGELRAPLGVIAVLGNHDWWNDGDRITGALAAHGIVVLENRAQAIEHGDGHRLYVAGLADALTRTPLVGETLASVPAGEPVLVLVHEPDVFPDVGARASLTLAGHTHGGQVRVPLLGSPVVPSKYGQRFAAGHVVEDGRHLFVTSGVGTSILPVRFGVPPELVVLTLR